MDERVQYLALVSSALALVYSLALNTFRVWVYEDHGAVDTSLELLINASPLAVSYVLADQCAEDPIVCDFSGLCLTAISIAMLFRSYRRAVSGTPFEKVNLEGKVYIITGANTGIGFCTALEIVRMGGTVVLACRSKEKALSARQKIIHETSCSEAKVIFIQLDLCSMKSVRKFVQTFNEMGLPLDCLINNAGMMTPKRQVTEDGYEMVFTANHLGHFLLTNLLLDKLELSNDGRILVLSSALHHLPSRFNFDDMMSEKCFSLFGTYAQSKLANLLFAFELNIRLRERNSKVTVNSLHPGCVITEVTRSLHVFVRIAYAVLYPVVLLFQKVPIQGAYTSIFAATSPRLKGVSGQYLFHSGPYPISAAAKNPTDARKLWNESLRLTEKET